MQERHGHSLQQFSPVSSGPSGRYVTHEFPSSKAISSHHDIPQIYQSEKITIFETRSFFQGRIFSMHVKFPKLYINLHQVSPPHLQMAQSPKSWLMPAALLAPATMELSVAVTDLKTPHQSRQKNLKSAEIECRSNRCQLVGKWDEWLFTKHFRYLKWRYETPK